MKKYFAKKGKQIVVGVIVVAGMVASISFNNINSNEVEATSNSAVDSIQERPVHHLNYKIDDEADVASSMRNDEKSSAKQREVLKAQRKAGEAERKPTETTERKAQQEIIKNRKRESREATVEKAVTTEKKEVHPAQSSSSSDPSSTKINGKSKEASKPAPIQKVEAKPVTKKQAEPVKPSIGSHKIGINGTFKSYTNYGKVGTEELQSGIDSGLIVAGITSFNGSDGETTYFGGHNPGIMKFMENNIHVGATVTITDGNGEVHNYKMMDKVDIDEYGEGVLSSIRRSAIDVYMYGTGTESILVQFCNTKNNLMSFWYGVKI